jgi:two-component system cell cycle sensor histidine kinase/response regulator CckA
MVGRHFEEFHAESEKSRVLRHFAQSLRHEEAVRIEMEVIRKDGTSAFVELHGSSLVKDGNTIGSQGIIRDVTERRKMRQSLLESEAKYRVLVELMPAVSYSAKVDEVSTATYISPQIEKITGFTPADYAADHELWTKCLHPEDRQRVMNALAHSHQSGESFVCEYRLIARDGHEVWVRDEGIIVGDDEGKPSHLHGVMYDITEQRKVDEEVRKSEIKYRTLVENLPTMVFLKDVNSVYVSCNQRFADDNGLRMEDILGKSDVDLFPGELAEKYRTDDVQIMESGQTRDIEEHYFRKGQDLVVHTIKTPVKDENGKVVGILGIFWDITEQKKAEEALKIRDSAIASSINGIAIADWQGMLTYVNASFLRMWGYDDEKEVLGRQAVELWHVPPDAVNMLEALRSRGSWMGGLKACRRDGSVFDAQVSAGTVVGESGRPICMMASFIDVTEARQKEEELSVFREKMVRAEQLASLGTLSATIAHELTQPLTVIRLSFENSLTDLKKTSCPERVIEDLRDGLDEVSNATSIVNRFRNYARKSELSLATDVDLKSVAERIVRLLGESARRAGVSVRIKDLDGLPRITANQKDMEQLFFALIENAIQAADGRESRWLILRGEVKDERVELQFSDTCGGIAPENLDKVFEPFFTTKPAGDGTGLGLCVARRIVARAGGRVRLESEPGVGSTFFVTLPIDERRTSRSGNSRK